MSYFLAIILLTTIFFLSFYAILGLNWYHIGLIPLFIGIGASSLIKASKYIQVLVTIIAMFEFYYVTYIYYFSEAGSNVNLDLQGHGFGVVIIAVLLIMEIIAIVMIWPSRK